MTVNTDTARNTYTGSGTTGPFAVTFRFLADEDLLVQKTLISTGVVTTLVLTTDYTVTGEGDDAGGNVTLVSSLASTYRLTITRNMEFTQETDYVEYDPFPANTTETALDKQMMCLQQLIDSSDRSIKINNGVALADFDTELPIPDEGDLYLKLNADGDALEWSELEFGVGNYSFAVGTGHVVQTSAGVSTLRTHTGTAAEITVTNGSGVSGNPTYSLPTALTFTGKTITGGTFSTPILQTPTISGFTVTATQAVNLGKMPTVQVLTSGTAATYTTPANVRWLKVTIVGGGGGGEGSGTADTGVSGSAGGQSAFSASFSASGGSGGASNNSTGVGGAGGVGSGCSINLTGQTGSGPQALVATAGPPSISGGPGGNSPIFNGAGIFSNYITGVGQGGLANTGGGGAGGVANAASVVTGSGGGGGGVGIVYITAPAATYTYTVGAGGAAGTAGTGGYAGGAGGSGLIIVEEFYN